MDKGARSKDAHYYENQIATTTLKVAQQNLETAKLAHNKMVEQLSMRTATIAQIAAQIMTSDLFATMRVRASDRDLIVRSPEKVAVKLATEIMVEAELSAAKEKELQTALETRG